MMERTADASPRSKARIAGVFYLLTFLTGGVAVFVSGTLVVSGDAAATATNILAHETLFRLGFAAYLLVVASYIAVTALFYELFKPVKEPLFARGVLQRHVTRTSPAFRENFVHWLARFRMQARTVVVSADPSNGLGTTAKTRGDQGSVIVPPLPVSKITRRRSSGY